MSTDLSVRLQAASDLVLGHTLFPLPVDEISLYVHIPFCTSRCRYCNFYFETGWSPRVLDRTLDTILEESRAFLPYLFPQGSPRVRTVYFGGGTPSIIPPARLDSFLGEFRELWNLPSSSSDRSDLLEFAFEANPETVSTQLLEVLGRHGVDRLSLGVQSFSTDALLLLGRRADGVEVERALTCISKARKNGIWKGKLNVDLIAGIPGQTVESIASDITRLLQYEPNHVSLYTLTVEPHTALQQLFDQGLRTPLEPELVEALWDTADQLLESAGFHNYEVSNYAQAGCESQHNLSYWELRPYLGLGAGAVGTIPVELRPAAGTGGEALRVAARLTNPGAMAYSRPGRKNWEHAVEVLTLRDFLVDHFLTGLRTEHGVNLPRLELIFGLAPGSLTTALSKLAAQWIASDFLQREKKAGQFALTRSGRFVLNPLLSDLLDALEPLEGELGLVASPRWP